MVEFYRSIGFYFIQLAIELSVRPVDWDLLGLTTYGLATYGLDDFRIRGLGLELEIGLATMGLDYISEG